jgi:hypothetical protein
MATPAEPELRRQVFTTSRELEYFSESELVTQTGYSKEEWWTGSPGEGVGGQRPRHCAGGGAGILDFSSRTSGKAA